MYSSVNLSIFLLASFRKPLSSNDKSCVKTSFERSIYPNGRSNAKTTARGFRRGTSNEGQSNKKCSVLSIPSLEGHIRFMVSRKLCLNL